MSTRLGEAWREASAAFTWPVLSGDDARRAVRAAIDAVVAHAYGLTRDQYAHVLSTFSHSSYKDAPRQCLAAFTQKHDPYWNIPLNETLPQPLIDLPIPVAAPGETPRPRTAELFAFQTTAAPAGSGELLTENLFQESDGSDMSLKPFTTEDLSRIANSLIRERGKTTTLEVKLKLRSEGFFAEQKTVSTLMQQLASREAWATRLENDHLIYYLATDAVASPPAAPSSLPTIVLVTVNDHETNALLDAFLGVDVQPKQEIFGGITYNLLGQHGGFRVVHTICEMGAGGMGASQQRTREAIEHYAPQVIIAVGIAFGMDEDKQDIGDVLVATQVVNYDLGRINADGTLTPRGDRPPCSASLVNKFKQTNTLGRRSKAAWPELRFGPVLSGQKLVDNVDYRASLKKLFTEGIGGEMEATGVYVSAASAKVDWIIIKAICDWGYNKNNPDKERWQQIAAKNAAWVTLAALDSSHLSISSPGSQSGGFQTIPALAQTGIVNTRWPAHFPQQLVEQADGLRIDGELRSAVINVMSAPEFPSLMSMKGALVENPVWDSVEAERVRKAYWPKGTRIPVIVRADMLLIRRNNQKHEGELLTYPSKWGTHMIHFRPWKLEQSPVDREQLNRTKFAAKWGVPPNKIEVTHTGMFSVSAKINEEYKDLWIYVFEFFSVRCSQWSEELQQIHVNGFKLGTPEEDKNRWRHLQEMRNDSVAFKVNGDVLRAVHQFFDVNLSSLPNSFPEHSATTVPGAAQSESWKNVHPTHTDNADSSAYKPTSKKARQIEEIRLLCHPNLLTWGEFSADAIRLVGSQDEAFRPHHVTVTITPDDYLLPNDLAVDRERCVALLENDAVAAGTYLFNGPCVRLIDHRASPRDSTEQKYLHLNLGRTHWYDYAVANQRFGDLHIEQLFGNTLDVRKFINFEHLLKTTSVRASSLCNILTVYASITTKDGYLVYSARGDRVASHRNMLMSAVSENLSEQKDGLFDAADGKAIFHAVARGIQEELTPGLQGCDPAARALLLGLSFHFQGYHPSLLFLVPIPYTQKELAQIFRSQPGTDFLEGSARFIHLDDMARIEDLLKNEPWFAAGKACVLRTFEYLTAIGRKGKLSMSQVAANLAYPTPP